MGERCSWMISQVLNTRSQRRVRHCGTKGVMTGSPQNTKVLITLIIRIASTLMSNRWRFYEYFGADTVLIIHQLITQKIHHSYTSKIINLFGLWHDLRAYLNTKGTSFSAMIHDREMI